MQSNFFAFGQGDRQDREPEEVELGRLRRNRMLKGVGEVDE